MADRVDLTPQLVVGTDRREFPIGHIQDGASLPLLEDQRPYAALGPQRIDRVRGAVDQVQDQRLPLGNEGQIVRVVSKSLRGHSRCDFHLPATLGVPLRELRPIYHLRHVSPPALPTSVVVRLLINALTPMHPAIPLGAVETGGLASRGPEGGLGGTGRGEAEDAAETTGDFLPAHLVAVGLEDHGGARLQLDGLDDAEDADDRQREGRQ
mmetsp:Transcript_12474/g.31437  ORF Transcript_12474/g.31437 Transcript_12474/m.31437 type:complete len:210 (-) Transcript_12474:1169-1798(-)